MGSLSIFISGGLFEGGHVPLQIISADASKQVRSELVLVNRPASIQLENGTYVIRARLPSGKSLDRTVVVSDQTGDQLVLRADDFSPNETAAWAYAFQYCGRSRHAQRKEDYRAVPTGVRTLPDWKVWQPSAGTEGGLQDRSFDWHALPPGDAVSDANAVMQITANLRSDRPACFELMDADARHSTFFALPAGTSKALVICETSPLHGASIQAPVNVVAEFGSADARSLLSYLCSSSTPEARLLGERLLPESVRALHGKTEDYTSAAVAGYFLVKVQPALASGGESIANVPATEIRQWIENLDRWFPDQPDGAVINGTLHLRAGDARLARERLLEGFKRGMPVFTVGIRMLWEGLRRLAVVLKDDNEVQRSYERLAPIAASIDWDGVLTCVRGFPTATQPIKRLVPIASAVSTPTNSMRMQSAVA